MSSFTVWLAEPRGFCRGVERAIEVAGVAALVIRPEYLYVKHWIVHNRFVVQTLERQGIIFVEYVSEIPRGAIAVFSAHGSPISDFEEARARGIFVIDATCQLVTKVHLEIAYYARLGYIILYHGHLGHPEQIGAFSHAPPNQIVLIQNEVDAQTVKLPTDGKFVITKQTTLPLTETRCVTEILRKRIPDIRIPSTDDICYATTNRQQVLMELAKRVDLMIVVGSPKSSNTRSLAMTANSIMHNAVRVNDASELDLARLNGIQSIGVTSGASTPDVLVAGVLDCLKQHGSCEVKTFKIFDEQVAPFPLPKELHSLMKERGVSREALEEQLISRAWSPSIVPSQPTL